MIDHQGKYQLYRMHTAVQPETDYNASTSGIGWPPPYDDSMKLNCDGTVANNGTKVGCGGIIRNSKGEYILGFSMNLGKNLSSYQNFLLFTMF